MEPTEHIDIDRFDEWLDRLVRDIASPAPDDATELAATARWLHEKGHQTMRSPSFDRRLFAQLHAAGEGVADSLPPPIAAYPSRPRGATTATPSSLRRVSMAAAVILIAIPVLILAVRSFGGSPDEPTIPAPANGLARSGTPVPCAVVQPSTLEISGTPEHTAILQTNGWADNPNRPGYAVPALYEGNLPDGPPASAQDLTEIQQTLAAFATCLYVRDYVSADAFFSDDSFRRTDSNRQDSFRVTVTPDPTMASFPTPTKALDTLPAPVIPIIVRSNVLSDGRIGVLLEQNVAGNGLPQYIILVGSERGWLIDEEITVTSTPNPSPEASSRTLEITAIDLQFIPSRIQIPADVDFTLVVKNEGVARKTFVIPELGIDEELPAGETLSVNVNAPKGVYEFYSDVPGQKAAGMRGWLIVIPGS